MMSETSANVSKAAVSSSFSSPQIKGMAKSGTKTMTMMTIRTSPMTTIASPSVEESKKKTSHTTKAKQAAAGLEINVDAATNKNIDDLATTRPRHLR